jgi:hypothetical protein
MVWLIRIYPEGAQHMPVGWHKPFLLTALGALLALSTTVTTLLATVLTPILSAVTSGKASYS